jgi:hypothetical protein
MGGPLHAAAFQQQPASPQYQPQPQYGGAQYGAFTAGQQAQQQPALQMSGMPVLGAGGLMGGGYPPKQQQQPGAGFPGMQQQQQQQQQQLGYGGAAGYGAPQQFGMGGVGSPAASQAAINQAFNFKF